MNEWTWSEDKQQAKSAMWKTVTPDGLRGEWMLDVSLERRFGMKPQRLGSLFFRGSLGGHLTLAIVE